MSGMTMSTPRSSASGNIMPASIKIMSSPERRTSIFMPNSPSPPRGIAKREGLSNVAHILMRYARPNIVSHGSAGTGKATRLYQPQPKNINAHLVQTVSMNPGNANLPIGVARTANWEIGVPGRVLLNFIFYRSIARAHGIDILEKGRLVGIDA